MIRYTPDGKVDRSEWPVTWRAAPLPVPKTSELANALDAANVKLAIALPVLQAIAEPNPHDSPRMAAMSRLAFVALRQIEEIKP